MKPRLYASSGGRLLVSEFNGSDHAASNWRIPRFVRSIYYVWTLQLYCSTHNAHIAEPRRLLWLLFHSLFSSFRSYCSTLKKPSVHLRTAYDWTLKLYVKEHKYFTAWLVTTQHAHGPNETMYDEDETIEMCVRWNSWVTVTASAFHFRVSV